MIAPLAELLLSQQGAQITRVALLRLPDRTGEIHLHEEVHAAAEVEPEVHRQGTEPGEPVGVAGARLSATTYCRSSACSMTSRAPELVFAGREPDEKPVGDLRFHGFDAGGLHPVDEPVAQGPVDGGAAHRRHLHRGILAEQIGKREEDADEQRHRDDAYLHAGYWLIMRG